MANEEHLAEVREGLEAWEWRRSAEPGFRPDLSGAHLIKAELSGAHLNEANLVTADLSEARCLGTSFCNVDFRARFYSRL